MFFTRSFIIICLHFHPRSNRFLSQLLLSPLLYQSLWLLGYFVNTSSTHLSHVLRSAVWMLSLWTVTWHTPLPSTNLDSGQFSVHGAVPHRFRVTTVPAPPTPGTVSPLLWLIFHHCIYHIQKHFIFHLIIYYPSLQLECQLHEDRFLYLLCNTASPVPRI